MHQDVRVSQVVVRVLIRSETDGTLKRIEGVWVSSDSIVGSAERQVSAIVVRRKLRGLLEHRDGVGILCPAEIEQAHPVIAAPVIGPQSDDLLVGLLGFGKVAQAGVRVSQAVQSL